MMICSNIWTMWNGTQFCLIESFRIVVNRCIVDVGPMSQCRPGIWISVTTDWGAEVHHPLLQLFCIHTPDTLGWGRTGYPLGLCRLVGWFKYTFVRLSLSWSYVLCLAWWELAAITLISGTHQTVLIAISMIRIIRFWSINFCDRQSRAKRYRARLHLNRGWNWWGIRWLIIQVIGLFINLTFILWHFFNSSHIQFRNIVNTLFKRIDFCRWIVSIHFKIFLRNNQRRLWLHFTLNNTTLGFPTTTTCSIRCHRSIALFSAGISNALLVLLVILVFVLLLNTIEFLDSIVTWLLVDDILMVLLLFICRLILSYRILMLNVFVNEIKLTDTTTNPWLRPLWLNLAITITLHNFIRHWQHFFQ